MSRLGSLDYLMLYAPDVEALVAFYRDVLGGTLIEEAYPHWARLRLANIDVGVHLGEPAAQGGPEPAFRVSDLAALRVHLQGAGVACEEYAALPGAVKLGFRDPAGNALQALQWGVDLDDVRGAASSAR